MGRHRRSDAGRAATGRTSDAGYGAAPGARDPQDSFAAGTRRGIAPYLNPEAYSETTARSTAYLYADDEPGGFPPEDDFGDGPAPSTAAHGGPAQGGRRRRKPASPVRKGLVGVSAVAVLGTAAVAAGAVPGLQNYRLGGGHSASGGPAQAAGVPVPGNSAAEQGGTSGAAPGSPAPGTEAPGAARGKGSAPSGTATPSPSTSASASASAPDSPTPADTPSKTPATKAPATKPKPSTPATGTGTGSAARPPVSASASASAPVDLTAAEAAETEVVQLVNAERAKVGCTPLASNSSLTKLAEDFSTDMAARDFFDHTDPDGRTPWDRAARAGITGLGGENIARGQSDAAAVVAAWMASPGHRANILNCDFKTIGVGVHFGPGGPWWTQDFGY
ncbi:CAP domain-containing protein [Streptomyces sp. J2-1]|uniref:CAP domain-containing protein n=1 Tax=Streptomyces corallincola TaxID=2851888 RepID=UPI001C3937CC|nr:CAP domain-containing protein [Streptomyces corallincola]MBV2353471.1 CAP domain-containing protein [Streptomyces corallincola]